MHALATLGYASVRIPVLERLTRRFRVRPVDAWLLSFPKSGRTWLRLMTGLAYLHQWRLPARAQPDALELEPLALWHPRIPRIRVEHEDAPNWKTPAELEATKESFAGQRVVLLVRDPRDVIVSLYHARTHSLPSPGFDHARHAPIAPVANRVKRYEGTLGSFLREEVGSLRSLLRWMRTWHENRHIPAGIHVVRYEDLHRDGAAELRALLGFLRTPEVSDAAISRAVRETAFDEMRRMELTDRFHSPRLGAPEGSDPNALKTRRGEVGDYRGAFSPEDCAWADDLIRTELRGAFGYGAAEERSP